MRSKWFKKAAAVSLAAAMLLGIVACGNDQGSSQSAGGGSGESKVSEAAGGEQQSAGDEGISPDSPYAGKGFDLSEHRDLIMYVVSDRPADMDKVLEKANTEYFEPWLNTTLTVEFLPWGVVGDKYTLILSGSDPADLIYSASWFNYASEAQNGAFKELTPEFLQKYLVYSYEEEPEVAWSQAAIGGKIYGVPKTSTNFDYNMLLIRQDLLDKYELGPINSWAALKEAMLTIAENEAENGIYGNGQRAHNEFLYTWLQDHGYEYLVNGYGFIYHAGGSEELPDFDKDVEFIDTSQVFYDFCVEMNEMAAKGVWSPNVINDTTDVQMQFESGRIASMLWNASINNAGKNMEEAGVGTYQIYDVTPDAKAMPQSYAGDMMSIPNNSQDPERAALVLDCMKAFRDLNLLLMGGIEGEHYILTEDGYMKVGPAAENYPWGGWAWGIQRNDMPVAYNTDERQLFYNDTCHAKQYNPKASGFSFNQAPVETELAVIGSITGEYSASFTLGMYGDDMDAKYQEYVEKLKEAGLDKVMAECKAQFEEYCAGLE